MSIKPRQRFGWSHQFGWAAIVAAVAVATWWGVRHARADDGADAKNQYQKATAHFAIGEYREAAAAYEAAFKLKQDPALLYDAAQSHRLAGDGAKALLLYRNLVKLYPESNYAADSRDHIEKLERAGVTSSTPLGATGTTPPAETGTPVAVVPALPVDAGVDGSDAPPPQRHADQPPVPSLELRAPGLVEPTVSSGGSGQVKNHLYNRWWFWTAAGGIAVAAVAVVAVALSGGKSWSTNPDVHGSP